MATNANIEVKTGVAQGDATNADDPPRKNVRTKAFPSEVFWDCIELDSVSTIIRPVASSRIGLFSLDVAVVPMSNPNNPFGFLRNVNDGMGISIISNNFNPIVKQIALDNIGNISPVQDPISLFIATKELDVEPNTDPIDTAIIPSVQNTEANPAANAIDSSNVC